MFAFCYDSHSANLFHFFFVRLLLLSEWHGSEMTATETEMGDAIRLMKELDSDEAVSPEPVLFDLGYALKCQTHSLLAAALQCCCKAKRCELISRVKRRCVAVAAAGTDNRVWVGVEAKPWPRNPSCPTLANSSEPNKGRAE